MSRSFLISASYDKEIRFWDVAAERIVRTVPGFDESQVNCMHLCVDNRYLVVGGSSALRVFDLECGTPVGGLGYPSIGVVARYECSGAVNFTSIGSFSIRKELGDMAARQLEESAVDFGGMTFNGPTLQSLLDADISLVLYTTSEDGNIRFFAGKFSGAQLRVVKTIQTGASITCSVLSPDSRFLLTGNQIGQICVWHMPTVIASIAIVSKRESAVHRYSQPAQKSGDETDGHKIGNESSENEVENARKLNAVFGNHPIQIISFENDYSAIRSVDLSPVGWWGAVATHCGNVHCLCLSKFAGAAPVKTEADSETEKRYSDSPAPLDPSGVAPIPLSGRKQIGRQEDGTQRARISTYTSALEANHQRHLGIYSGDVGSGVQAGNLSSSMGKADAQKNISSEQAEENNSDPELRLLGLTGKASSPDNHIPTVAKTTLQKEFDFQVFHSFQAHHKYILRVRISPNNKMLVTCSADYSLGRFIVPDVLQEWRMSTKSSRSSCSIGEAGLSSWEPVKENIHLLNHGDVVSPELSSKEIFMNSDASLKSGSGQLEKEESKNLNNPLSNPTAHVDPVVGEQKLPASESASVPPAAKEASSSEPVAEKPLKEESTSKKALSGITFNKLKPLIGHDRWVWDCVFSACCGFLFSGGSDAKIRMWSNLNDENCPSVPITGHTKPVLCLLLYYEKAKDLEK